MKLETKQNKMASDKSESDDLHEIKIDVENVENEEILYQTAVSYEEFMKQFSEVENKAPYTYHVSAETKDFRKTVYAQDIIKNNKEVPKIRWEMNHKCDSFPIKFTGIPYIWLGRQVWNCTCAKDRNANKTLKKTQQDSNEVDTPNSFLTYTSAKKVQCQVKFMVKKIMIFPGYKIEKDTRSKRDVISHTLRQTLKTLPGSKHRNIDNHQMGITQYLWQYPMGIHTNINENHQLSGANNGFLDKRVESYIHSIICEGITEINELQTKIKEYVNNVLFLRPIQENRFSRQFLPEKQQLRKIVYNILLQERISKASDSGLDDLYKYWHKTAYVYFKPLVTNSTVENESEEVEKNVAEKMTKVDSINYAEVEDGVEDFFYSSFHRRKEKCDSNGKMMFVYMSAQMMRFYRIHASHLLRLETTYRSINFPVPFYFLVVQANFHYQIVAIIVVQEETSEMLSKALSVIKGWVPDINPRFGIVNKRLSEKTAMEEVFPQIEVYFCDSSREEDWYRQLPRLLGGKFDDVMCACNKLKTIAQACTEEELQKAREILFSWDGYNGKFKTWFENSWMNSIESWSMFYRPVDLMPVRTSRDWIESLHLSLWYDELKEHNKCSLSELLIILVEKYLPKHRTTFTPLQPISTSWDKVQRESHNTNDTFAKRNDSFSMTINNNCKNVEEKEAIKNKQLTGRKRTYSTYIKGQLQAAIQTLTKYTQKLNEDRFMGEITREIKRITDNTKRHIEGEKNGSSGKQLTSETEHNFFYNSNTNSESSLRTRTRSDGKLTRANDNLNRYMQLLQYDAMKRLIQKDGYLDTSDLRDDILLAKKCQLFECHDKASNHISVFRKVMRKPNARVKEYFMHNIELILQEQLVINDKLIDLTQDILHFQFPKINGFLHTNSEKIYQKHPFFQIVSSNGSWATVSSFQDNHVSYYDALILSHEYLIQPLTIRSICHIVHCTEPVLDIYINPVQQQSSSLVSGYFAIAFAVDLLFGNNPNLIEYDELKFSSHLVKCLKQYYFEPFPRTTTKRQPMLCEALTQSTNIFCVCRDMFLPDDPVNDMDLFMALCITCNEWFHRACARIPNEVFTSEHKRLSWKCHNCM